MKQIMVLDNGAKVFMVRDERGESESYEAYSLESYGPDGRRCWVEGIRKDRSAMRPEWRVPVEAALAQASA